MRILFLFVLIAIVAGAWWVTRHMAGEDDLTAIVVFPAATTLREGDPITLDGSEIGSVTAVEPRSGGEAIRVRIDGSARADVRSDSIWRVDDGAGVAVLILDNRVAVGRPVEEGATLRGGDDPTRRWVERGREWLGRVATEVERLGRENDMGDIERQFDEWTAQIPAWKVQGEEALRGARDQIEPRMRELETKLRDAGREAEAQKVRALLDEWLAKVRNETPPPPTSTGESP